MQAQYEDNEQTCSTEKSSRKLQLDYNSITYPPDRTPSEVAATKYFIFLEANGITVKANIACCSSSNNVLTKRAKGTHTKVQIKDRCNKLSCQYYTKKQHTQLLFGHMRSCHPGGILINRGNIPGRHRFAETGSLKTFIRMAGVPVFCQQATGWSQQTLFVAGCNSRSPIPCDRSGSFGRSSKIFDHLLTYLETRLEGPSFLTFS